MISFRCKTKDFRDTLDALRVIHKRKRMYNIKVTCEITLINGHVKLAIPGSIFGFNCQTKGTAKATLMFRNLYGIIEHHRMEDMLVEFYDGSLRFGIVQVKAQTIFFNDDSVLRSIIIPNNFTDLDLLLLKNEGYTMEELAFNNLLHVMEMAERRVYYNVRRSASYLRDYGIMPKEIKKLLVEKLGIRLDLDEKDVKLLLSND